VLTPPAASERLASAACRLSELPWSSPRAGIACLRHAGCSTVCQLKQLAWGSPSAGTACPRRASCNDPCRLVQRTWSSPRAGIACRLHAICSDQAVMRAALSRLGAALVLAHRLPPPCATQCSVPPVTAALTQPSCWQRLPPPARCRSWSGSTATEPLATLLEAGGTSSGWRPARRLWRFTTVPLIQSHTALISAPTSAPPPTTPLLCRSLTFRGEG
jgi:hypothetical protein